MRENAASPSEPSPPSNMAPASRAPRKPSSGDHSPQQRGQRQRAQRSTRTGAVRNFYVSLLCLCATAVFLVVLTVAVPNWWDIAVRQPIRRWTFSRRNGIDLERAPRREEGEGDVDSKQPPPPPRGLESGQPALSTRPSSTGQRNTSAHTLHCYTLEDYSDQFLRARSRRSRTRYFQCGVRVTDLRTTHRSDHREACEGATGADTAYESLRILLTEKEVAWHRQWQLNAATQHISLDRFNDDYCDCMDGTDELLTNACSMVTGSGMPVGTSRWRSHLIAMKDVQIYEDVPPLKDDDKSRRMQAFSRQGPVLPVPCVEDPSVLLSPSMMADGLVDCTDGSDESATAWRPPFARKRRETVESRTTAKDEHLDDREERMQRLREAAAESARRVWRARLDRLAPLREQAWVAPSSAYVTPVYPHDINARALLVEGGYLSLFTTGEVLAARVETQEVLHNIFVKGHALYKTRVARGWDKLGKVITDRRTEVTLTLANITHRYEQLRQHVYNEVQRHGVQTPAEAHVDPQILHELEQLEMAKADVKNDLDYHDIMIQQRLFGDYYEYYPLYTKQLSLPYAHVVDPYRTSEVGKRASRGTRMTVVEALIAQRREAHRLAMQGHDLPSASSAASQVLHVDNITVDLVGIHYGRHLLWRQMFSLAEEGEVLARTAGLIAPDAPYDPAVLTTAPGESPFRRTPSLVTGHWMPSGVQQAVTLLSVTDPAGDVALPRRLMVRPESPLLRGGGVLQHRYRQVDKDRFMTIKTKDDSSLSAAERLRKKQTEQTSADDKAGDVVKVPLFHHQNTPNKVARHLFLGGALRCEDTLPEAYRRAPSTAGPDAMPTRTSWGSMVAACDVNDRILSWSMDGRCLQEVVVGTPSACAGWVVEASKQRLREYKKQLAEWNAREA